MKGRERFEKKMEMEYSSNSGTPQVNTEQNSTMFQGDTQELELDPRFVDIRFIKINRNGVIVNFSSMVFCEKEGEQSVTKMYGVTKKGKIPDSFINQLHCIKDNIYGEKRKKTVERQRDRNEKRRKIEF